MNSDLCDVLTGSSDSQTMLAHLEGANLFVVSLDAPREWYRYHHLFAELMRLSLPAPEQQRLHQRAVVWYEAAGYPDQAVRHALAVGRISGDFAEAARLIGLAAGDALHRGDIQTVQRWLEALPHTTVQQDGLLSVYAAWSLALGGHIDQITAPLTAAHSTNETVRRLAALLKGFQGLLDRTIISRPTS
jgi:LuxR family transcriptional regulator, maltose regulon positive regulatory protein